MRKSAVDLSLILPCYNETPVFVDSVAHIASVLDRSTLTYEIIFVDDCSRDTTPNLIRDAVRHTRRYRALFHKWNMGRGRTVADGIALARGTVVGYIDIDCEVSPVYIPSIVSLIQDKKADVVVGERIYRSSFGSFVREVLSIGYRRLVSTLLPTGGIDTESGYKFFNRTRIVPVSKKTLDPHWFWDTEIIVRSQLAGLRIQQVPVLFLRRFDKQSSVHILADTISYLRSILQLKHQLSIESQVA